MANEELILERLIRLTKSGKILWWRTGKVYKTKISKNTNNVYGRG